MDWVSLTGSTGTAGAISRWMNNSSITIGSAGDADGILQEAQDWIYRRLRHWRMLTPPTTGTLTSGSDALTLPSDCLEPDFLVLTGTSFYRLRQKPMQEVIMSWAFDGNGNRIQQQPTIYYFDQAAIRFDSVADQPYPYALTYYQQPAVLSATNTTNFLTQYCQRLVRCACMVGAAEWAKDSGTGNYDRTYWEQAATDELDTVQRESDRARRATEAGAVMIGGGPGGDALWSW